MDGIHALSLPITSDSTIHKMHSIAMYKTYKCASVCLDWPKGSLFESYLWQIHNSPMDVPWSFFAYDSKSKEVSGVWTYNMAQHFSFSHLTYTISDPCLSHEFRQSIQITKLEQTQLHIPESALLAADDLEEPRIVNEEGSTSIKRKQGNSSIATMKRRKE